MQLRAVAVLISIDRSDGFRLLALIRPHRSVPYALGHRAVGDAQDRCLQLKTSC
ncbi:protein of unknown function (plasmid) [Caballeronia sp. S22]